MVTLDPAALKKSARESIASSNSNPRRLVIIYTGFAILVGFILTVANYSLDQMMRDTGGLDGMDMRSSLTTAQITLQLAQPLLLPFWNMGYTYITLKLARRQEAATRDLAEGFRQFGPVLRYTLLQNVIYGAIMVLCVNLANTVFLLTPWAAGYKKAVADGASQAQLDILMSNFSVPMAIITLVFIALLLIPVMYRLRMASYRLMDHPEEGAFAALQASRFMTKNRCMKLLKVDLSFWWFYVLDFLVVGISNGGLILSLLNIKLPFSSSFIYFGCFVLYLLTRLALYAWKQNEVSVTYAHAYEELNACIIPKAPKIIEGPHL